MGRAYLSARETRLWHAWKLAGDTVMAQVERSLVESAGISGADFGVLSRLVDLGAGTLRQQGLAESMRWDKSRLSHHLSRMEARGLLRRKPTGGKGVEVKISAAGEKLLQTARAIHAKAIREHLFGPLSAAQIEDLLQICERLQGPDVALPIADSDESAS